jgi:cytochrome oxidase assembly protein ShyY1
MDMETRSSNSWYWPLFGAAAGILGAIGHLFTDANLSDQERASGVALVDSLDRTGFHVGIIAGLAAVFCLLVFAAGWRRWAEEQQLDSLAATVVTFGFIASAGAMILGYGFKGSLAVYLPGGIDAGQYPDENLLSVFMFNDFAPFISWYGVAMAAAAMAWVALRERRLPIWIGIVSAIFVLLPVGFLVATGLPGFPGVVDPFWIVIVGIGLAVKQRGATVRSAAPVFQVAAS